MLTQLNLAWKPQIYNLPFRSHFLYPTEIAREFSKIFFWFL